MTLAEEDRQLVLLSLALCAIDRPGFDAALRSIAGQFDGVELFEQFKTMSDDDRRGWVNIIDRITRTLATDRIACAQDVDTFVNPITLEDIAEVNAERAQFALRPLSLDEFPRMGDAL